VSAGRRAPDEAARPSRGGKALALLLAALLLAGAGFTALGIWQLGRLQWKQELIERVAARIHAAPVAPPPPAEWQDVRAATHEYRRLRLQGRFLTGHDTRVQAVTVHGPGFWILSPFETRDGAIVLVNRGFVPRDWRAPAPRPGREITGLLRLPEPGGGFLRRNDAAAGRWYSRDVDAIAAARGLINVAPFFVDEEAGAGPAAGAAANSAAASGATLGASAAWPKAGLTVVRFRNQHLGYALTWFGLALMCAGAFAYVLRDARRRVPARP
jgi:surfeit locus 1 family protein